MNSNNLPNNTELGGGSAVWLQGLGEGSGLRLGTVTHLPQPLGGGERPSGAEAAASSREGCPSQVL